MSEYKKISTSPEVWAVIRAKHNENLVVFGSFSEPDGNETSDDGIMMTSYGFKDASCPLIEARTTWTIDQKKPYKRINQINEWWLCYPTEEAQ